MLPDLKALSLIRKIMSGPSEDFRSIVRLLLDEDLLVATDDGSLTIRSEEKTEMMHSSVGAIRESIEKFSIPSDLKNLQNPLILDLCSGLGYNTLAALNENFQSSVHMIEISKEMIFLSRYLNNNLPYKELVNEAVDFYFYNNNESEKIKIFCEDARMYIRNVETFSYDIVFHDGFSPAHDPLLYTVDFLSFLFKSLKKDGLLLSYSSSIPFRSALVEAGFYLGEGPSIGRKRGITMASLKKDDYRVSNRLSFSDEKLIALSSIGIPFRDHNLNMKSEEIIKNRHKERLLYKSRYSDMTTKKIKKDLIDEYYFHIYNSFDNSRDSILAMKDFLLTKKKI